MKKIEIQKLVLSALFLAVGMVLPLLTGQIKEIGDSLLPMHLPVMLCGLICGWKYGLAVGFILPFLRSVSFGMPPLYPNCVWMSLELSAYGLIIGLMYNKIFKRKTVCHLYLSLIISMLGGRVVWGISKAILLGVANKPFPFSAFLVGGFIDAIIGIIIQLILIPLIIQLLKRTRLNQIMES